MNIINLIKYWMNHLHFVNPDEFKESIEDYIIDNNENTRIKLLHNMSAIKALDSQFNHKIEFIDFKSINLNYDIESLYEFHIVILCIEKILPIFDILKTIPRDEADLFEKNLSYKLSILENRIEQNQKNFFISWKRQEEYISRYRSQKEVINVYNNLLKDQKRTYFSMVNSLVGEFKLSTQLDLQNADLFLEERSSFPGQASAQIDTLISTVLDMKNEMNIMSKKIKTMNKYINSKLELI